MNDIEEIFEDKEEFVPPKENDFFKWKTDLNDEIILDEFGDKICVEKTDIEKLNLIFKTVHCLLPSNYNVSKIDNILVYTDGVYTTVGARQTLYNRIKLGYGNKLTDSKITKFAINLTR